MRSRLGTADARWLRLLGFLLVGSGAFSPGCVVAPCPSGVVCGVAPETGGTGGTGAGGRTSGGGGSTAVDGGGMGGGGAPDAMPLPGGAWTNYTANLAGMKSVCGTLSLISAMPDEDSVIAGVDELGLWKRAEGDDGWAVMGTAKKSVFVSNSPNHILYDPQNPGVFWEAGIHEPSGIYRTDDNGVTFTQLGDLISTDAVSVDFTDPARKTLLAGGHEVIQTLFRSTDGGQHWDNVGVNLPANSNHCTSPLVIDAKTHLVGCAGYAGGLGGIFRTTDGGKTWTHLTDSGGARPPLVASDNAIYWATANMGGMVVSNDNGETFTDVVGAGKIQSMTPVELPDGRLVALGLTSMVISDDKGATWSPASAALPYSDVSGYTYSSRVKAFFVWHFACGTAPVNVPDDAVMRFDFDYTAK